MKLLESVAASEPIARKLGAIREARWPVEFSHVIEPAQAFLAAVIAHACHGRPPDDRHAADSTIWVLCPSVHSQELLYESLLNWRPDALFRPEFFGDQIESLREFDIDSQTSVRDLASVDIWLGQGAAASEPPGRSGHRPSLVDDQSGFVRDYVAPNHLIIAIEPDMEGGVPATPCSPTFAALRRGKLEVAPPHIQISEGWIQTGPEDFTGAFEDCDIGEF